jgi:hypothetical protein
MFFERLNTIFLKKISCPSKQNQTMWLIGISIGLSLSLMPYGVYYAQGIGEQPNLRRAPSSPYSAPNCGCGDNETCVDSWSSDSSNATKLYYCQPNDSTQTVSPTRLINKWTDTCLASLGDSKAIDNPVVVAACSGAANTLWDIANNGEIRNRWTNTCLASLGDSKAIDNPVVVAACSGNANILWSTQKLNVSRQRTHASYHCLNALVRVNSEPRYRFGSLLNTPHFPIK